MRILLIISLLFGVGLVCADQPKTAVIERQWVTQTFPAAGHVVADQRMTLAVRVSGRLAQLLPRSGDILTSGQVLARIEAPELDAEKQQREAELNAAKSEQQDAKADAARLNRLISSKAISQDDLRNARVRLSRAKAAVAGAHAQLQALQVDLDERVLRSPGALRVLRRLVEPGRPVEKNTALLEVESVAGVRFEAYVLQTRLRGLEPGQSLSLSINKRRYSGHIKQVLMSADPVTRRGKLEIHIDAPADLMVGQYGLALLPDAPSKLLLMPEDALVERAGIRCVFVLDEDHRVQLRSVRLGKQYPQTYQLLAGIEAGERVLLNPSNALRSGAIWTSE